jgi:hypothetical protein
MAAQIQLKIYYLNDVAVLTSESALYMIGAVDEVKIKNKGAQHTKQQKEKNNGSTDLT